MTKEPYNYGIAHYLIAGPDAVNIGDGFLTNARINVVEAVKFAGFDYHFLGPVTYRGPPDLRIFEINMVVGTVLDCTSEIMAEAFCEQIKAGTKTGDVVE